MIGRTNAGGGGLNFKVNAYSELPETGKENEIAVITSTPMTGYVMQAEQPTGTQGFVWIELGESSDAAFYADKKQVLKIYPVKVNQYIDSEWNGKETYIYQNGEWVELPYAVWIFKNGSVVPFNSYNRGNATITINDVITIAQKSGENFHQCGVYTTAKINLTPYKKLCVEAQFTSIDTRVAYGVSGSYPTGENFASYVASADFDTVSNKFSLDISNVSGEYYFVVFSYGGVSGSVGAITKIWLE